MRCFTNLLSIICGDEIHCWGLIRSDITCVIHFFQIVPSWRVSEEGLCLTEISICSLSRWWCHVVDSFGPLSPEKKSMWMSSELQWCHEVTGSEGIMTQILELILCSMCARCFCLGWMFSYWLHVAAVCVTHKQRTRMCVCVSLMLLSSQHTCTLTDEYSKHTHTHVSDRGVWNWQKVISFLLFCH